MRKKILLTLAILLSLLVLVGFNYKKLPSKLVNMIDYTRCNIVYGLNKPKTQGNVPNSESPSGTFHARYVKPDISLDELIKNKGIKDSKNFNIFIDLSKRTLHFKYKEEVLKEYVISAGTKSDYGDKEIEGDYKTPRGKFYICQRQVYLPTKKYLGSRWMLLSYPNMEAAERGIKDKLISKKQYDAIKEANGKKEIPPQDTKLGSYVGIHGGALPNYPRDWTAGCIGMYDQDAEEIYKYAKSGTQVIIR